MSVHSTDPKYQERIDQLYEEIRKNGGPTTYKVTIHVAEKGVYSKSGDWVVLEEATEEEKAVMGYAPSTPYIDKSERTIYVQEVSEIDLGEIVKAVNKIK